MYQVNYQLFSEHHLCSLITTRARCERLSISTVNLRSDQLIAGLNRTRMFFTIPQTEEFMENVFPGSIEMCMFMFLGTLSS